MDIDMDFGDVQETVPPVQLRPSENRHFAVAACGHPAPTDLPVFIDLDAMRDMEAHALSDTSVELGGVLLGGQFYDNEGQPFVVITDSLRARHYESTKGSFKFTHDTWSRITRERDEFPPELQMVGWYHTHPDWGVFLSGMDTFICEHFFNKSLDVALVIDPCRGDRGIFQWDGGAVKETRRTGGFYLIASRFREDELRGYVAQLESGFVMSTESRTRSSGWGASPAPVLHLTDARGSWMAGFALALLSIQLLLLALIAWKLLATPPGSELAGVTQEVAELRGQLEADAQAQRAALRADAHAELLTAIVGQIQGDEGGLVETFEQQREENERLSALARGQVALERQLRAENEQLARKQTVLQADYARREKQWKDDVAALRRKSDDLRHKSEEHLGKIALLNQELSEYRPDGGEQSAQSSATGSADADDRLWNWKWISIAIGGVVVLLLGGAAVTASMRKEAAEPEDLNVENISEPPAR